MSILSLQMQSGERLLVKPISKCDSSTQTDTHLVETNIVKSYEWNEWRLRWKAMQLVSRSVSVHPERLTFVVKSGCLNQLGCGLKKYIGQMSTKESH